MPTYDLRQTGGGGFDIANSLKFYGDQKRQYKQSQEVEAMKLQQKRQEEGNAEFVRVLAMSKQQGWDMASTLKAMQYIPQLVDSNLYQSHVLGVQPEDPQVTYSHVIDDVTGDYVQENNINKQRTVLKKAPKQGYKTYRSDGTDGLPKNTVVQLDLDNNKKTILAEKPKTEAEIRQEEIERYLSFASASGGKDTPEGQHWLGKAKALETGHDFNRYLDPSVYEEPVKTSFGSKPWYMNPKLKDLEIVKAIKSKNIQAGKVNPMDEYKDITSAIKELEGIKSTMFNVPAQFRNKEQFDEINKQIEALTKRLKVPSGTPKATKVNDPFKVR